MRLKFKDTHDAPTKPAPSLPSVPAGTDAVKVTGRAKCGHETDKLGPPQFRKSMLANIASRDCPTCRKARHLRNALR